MAGHSKFANIKHRKNAQDKKRGNLFTKLAREIIVAAKLGQPDPAFNPRLRAAIAAAKAQSMPKDRIDNAIKRGSGDTEGENYEEMRYEGYGPGGVALIIDALTDNRNRTAAEMRTILGKAGGSLGETGSVSFQFTRVGRIFYRAEAGDPDTVFEQALEAGAQDCESDASGHVITTGAEDLHSIAETLGTALGEPEKAQLDWQANTPIALDEKGAEQVLRLIDTLEDSDDVQTVASNAEIADEILEKLTA